VLQESCLDIMDGLTLSRFASPLLTSSKANDGTARCFGKRTIWLNITKLLLIAALVVFCACAIWRHGVFDEPSKDLAPRATELSAQHGKSGFPLLHWFMFLAAVLILFMGAWLFMMMHLGTLLSKIIQQVDRHVIGTDVLIGDLKLYPAFGEIKMTDVAISNPEPFQTDYLLRAATIWINIHMSSFFTSLGRGLEITYIKIVDVDVNVEYTGSMFSMTSNVQTMLDFLGDTAPSNREPSEEEDEKEENEAEAVEHEDAITLCSLVAVVLLFLVAVILLGLCASELHLPVVIALLLATVSVIIVGVVLIAAGVIASVIMGGLVGASISGRRLDINVKELLIENVGCVLNIRQSGMHVQLADIRYDNFSEEVGSHYLDDIAFVIIRSLAKSVLANIVGGNLAHQLM